MRVSANTKSNFIIITLFILLFAIPFATTLLLDLKFVQQQFARKLLVYLLLLSEVLIFLYLLVISILNGPKNK